jgi:Na+-driven multidrug efflux pump
LIQALTLIFSRYIGAQEYQKIWKSWRAGLFLVGVVNGGLSIPFLFFPDFTLSFFFAELPLDPLREYLRLNLCWIWGWVLCNSLAGLFLSFLLAIGGYLFPYDCHVADADHKHLACLFFHKPSELGA